LNVKIDNLELQHMGSFKGENREIKFTSLTLEAQSYIANY